MMGKIKQLEPLGLALLGVFLVLSFIYGVDHRFFFLDDRQAQYFPYGLIIRDALLHGELPFTTIHTFYGGALWLDPQYGLYNPLSLALDFLIVRQALEYSGYLVALVLNLLFAAGVYSVGRAYGLRREFSALMGLMMGINIFVLYFHSDTWQPGLVSLVFSVFAWASLKTLLAAQRHVAPRVLLSALLIFLTVSGGWPHQYIALAAVMAVLFIEEWRFGNRAGALRLVYAGALAAVFSTPVLLPVMAAREYWARSGGFYNHGVLSPELGDILNFSNPAWLPRYRHLLMQVLPVPFFFAAWFALPLLCVMDWEKVKKMDMRRAELPLLLTIFTLMILSAQNIGPLRWPVRWLPDAHLVLMMLLLLGVQKAGLKFAPARIQLALGALAVTTLAAFLESPLPVWNVLWLVLLPAAFIAALPLAKAPEALPTYLGATSVAIAMVIGLCFSSSSIFLDHGKQNTTIGVNAQADDGSEGYELYWGMKKNISDMPNQRDFLGSGMGGYYNVNTTNGYSSLLYKGLERVFPDVDAFADFTSLRKPNLTLKESETGDSFLDLFKIRKIVAEKKAAPDGINAQLPGHWQRSESRGLFLFEHREKAHMALDQDKLVTFERRDPFHLPGTVSWRSSSVSLGPDARAEANGESFAVATGAKAGMIVFARLYYPGFTARLDNMPLKVRALDHMLVVVDLPANAKGRLHLHFTPPLLNVCYATIAFALLIWAVAALLERRRSARP